MFGTELFVCCGIVGKCRSVCSLLLRENPPVNSRLLMGFVQCSALESSAQLHIHRRSTALSLVAVFISTAVELPVSVRHQRAARVPSMTSTVLPQFTNVVQQYDQMIKNAMLTLRYLPLLLFSRSCSLHSTGSFPDISGLTW